MTSPDRETARLAAVVAAVEAEIAKPGPVTKAEIRAALATPAPEGAVDPVPPTVEETV